jgi:hypothetical protein
MPADVPDHDVRHASSMPHDAAPRRTVESSSTHCSGTSTGGTTVACMAKIGVSTSAETETAYYSQTASLTKAGTQ